MGIFDTVTRWFKREAAEVKEGVAKVEDRLDADMTRRERDLAATPQERMDAIAQETPGDDLMAQAQAKIDAKQALADANEELADRTDAKADEGTKSASPDGLTDGPIDDTVEAEDPKT